MPEVKRRSLASICWEDALGRGMLMGVYIDWEQLAKASDWDRFLYLEAQFAHTPRPLPFYIPKR